MIEVPRLLAFGFVSPLWLWLWALGGWRFHFLAPKLRLGNATPRSSVSPDERCVHLPQHLSNQAQRNLQ